ncbi:MAG: hypothetical protein ACOXZ9_00010 [Bacteroidales bacterium]
MQPERVQMFPNLRWLPSRSADPRVSHTVFYNRVWAKNDPIFGTTTHRELSGIANAIWKK